MHPFDQAIALTAQGADTFHGQTSPAYWNMVGPFGGVLAATALNAVLRHAALLGEPVSLTVNYAAALAAGPFTVLARAVRTNRSTQHWVVEMAQLSPAGMQETVLTASVITAVRRTTWGVSDTPMPEVAAPTQVVRSQGPAPVEWLYRYDMRFATGPLPRAWDGAIGGDDPRTASQSRIWMRDDPVRSLDFCSLAAYADIFFPRVWLRRARRVPVGTVSMTVYFHAGGAALQASGSPYVLGEARGQVFRNGFYDQSAQLWSESGNLLATSLQVVYFKE